MRVFMTGGTGLIGRQVSAALAGRGDEVVCVTRDPRRAESAPAIGARVVAGDPTQAGPWQAEAAAADAVINLAGESIAAGWFWTGGRKQRLRRSRLRTTAHVAAAIREGGRRCVLLSGSATGYYGDGGEAALPEDRQPGDDFLARLATEWERAALAAESDLCRVVCLRMGVVLARNGGALAKLVPVFRRRLGGPLGSGRQYFPWIHIDDLVRAVLFALDTPDLHGPVNAVAPDPPRQREFARALGRALGESAWVPAPAWALRLALGEKADLLLASQRAVPAALRARGFRFEQGDLERALADLLGPASPGAAR